MKGKGCKKPVIQSTLSPPVVYPLAFASHVCTKDDACRLLQCRRCLCHAVKCELKLHTRRLQCVRFNWRCGVSTFVNGFLKLKISSKAFIGIPLSSRRLWTSLWRTIRCAVKCSLSRIIIWTINCWFGTSICPYTVH